MFGLLSSTMIVFSLLDKVLNYNYRKNFGLFVDGFVASQGYYRE